MLECIASSQIYLAHSSRVIHQNLREATSLKQSHPMVLDDLTQWFYVDIKKERRKVLNPVASIKWWVRTGPLVPY